MGGKGAKKAASKAAKAQTQISEANNELVRWNYGQNAARLDPYAAGGTRAGNVLMELLLGPAPAGSAGGSGSIPGVGAPVNQYGYPTGMPSDWDRIVGYRSDDISSNFTPAALPWVQSHLNLLPANYSGPSWDEIMAMPAGQHDNARDNAIQAFGSVLAANAQNAPQAPATPPPGATNPQGQPTSALSAWDQFRNGTNYQWRLGQGQDVLEHSFLGGPLDTGANRIAELEYGQNFASNELGNWMNMLAGQQGVGLSAASALAGVGNSALGAMMGNNQNAADARSNAALAAGQANQGMWGSIGQGIGQFGGALASSYADPNNGFMFNPSHPSGAGYRGGSDGYYIPGGGIYGGLPDYLQG